MKQQVNPGTLIQRWTKMSIRAGTPLYASIREAPPFPNEWIVPESNINATINSGQVALIIATVDGSPPYKKLRYLLTPQGIGWFIEDLTDVRWWNTLEEIEDEKVT